MKNDPIVEETHAIRDRLAADLGYEVSRIFADIRSREHLLGDRLKNRQKGPNKFRIRFCVAEGDESGGGAGIE